MPQLRSELLLSTIGTSIRFLDKIQTSNIGGAGEAVHSTAEEVKSFSFYKSQSMRK